ncbi:MAG TPA: helix-turn-helix domain-containing protein [Candidatus Paceibacterota bacterium]
MLPSFDILEEVAAAYNVSVDDMLAKNRTKEIAEARQLAAYILRELNDLSYPAIGKIMGRDHTTMIHSYNKISQEIKTNPQYRDFAEKLFGALKGAEVTADVADVASLTSDEIKYLHKTLSKETKEKNAYGFETSEDILKLERNLEITEREADILAKYRAGMTLEEIAPTAGVTRERVRQIVMHTLIKELGQKARNGFKIDVKEYIGSQKSIHNRSRYLPEGRRKEIADKLESGLSVEEVLKTYKLSEEKFLESFPQYEGGAELEFGKKKRWSRSYDKCRGCGTTVTPHLRRGYCEACLGGLRKKRREEIIQKFGNKCARCGITRPECFRKYKRDFYLTKKLAGEPFAPLCRGCFLQLGGVNLANKRWGR